MTLADDLLPDLTAVLDAVDAGTPEAGTEPMARLLATPETAWLSMCALANVVAEAGRSAVGTTGPLTVELESTGTPPAGHEDAALDAVAMIAAVGNNDMEGAAYIFKRALGDRGGVNAPFIGILVTAAVQARRFIEADS